LKQNSRIERNLLLFTSLIFFLAFTLVVSSSLRFLPISNAQTGSLIKSSSGLVASDPLNKGISSYWTFGGDAPAEGAPYTYYDDSAGLHIGVEAPSTNVWAGYFAVAENLPFELIHVTVTAPAKTVPSGAYETGIYVQSSSGVVNYVTCTSYTNSQGTFWEVVSALGNTQGATQYTTLYEDTSTNQPLTQDCTIITNGNNFLEVYFGSSLVYESSSLNLQISEPFQVYLEPETSYAGALLNSTFLNYYITSSQFVNVSGLPSNAALAEIINPSSGSVIASSGVSDGNATFDVGADSMPIQAVIEVFDSGNNLLASTDGSVGLYGGDVYSYSQGTTTTSDSSTTITTSTTATTSTSSGVVKLTIHTVNQKGKAITGYYVELTQNGNFVAGGYSPVSFKLQSSQTYVVTPENYGNYSFACWKDTKSTTASRSVSLTQSETLVAVYSNTGKLPRICGG
jgi:hypothetical protein